MATRERIHSVARLNELYERTLLVELREREEELTDLDHEIKQMNKRIIELSKEEEVMDKANGPSEITLDFISSYTSLIPTGCPEPWGTALRDWSGAAESSLFYPPAMTGVEHE